MALPVHVATGPVSSTTTNPATITYPAGVQAGDLLLMHWGIASGIQVPVVSGELANWNEIGPAQNGDFPRQWLYIKEAAGTESSGTFEVSSDGTALKIIRVLVFRGGDMENFPFVYENRADNRIASTDQVTHPDLTTAGDDRLGLCFFVSNPDTATADFTGETGGDFAEIATASSTAGASLTTQVQAAGLATATTVSGGSFTAGETLAAFRTIVLALKPPPAPTSTVGPASSTITNPATVTYPADIQAGDLLLMHWGIASGIQIPVVSGELSNWDEIGPVQNGDFPRQWLYVKRAVGGESNNTFEVSSDGTALKIIRVLAFRGVDLEDFPLVFEGRDDNRVASTDQVTHPDLTTSGADRLGLCFFVSNPDTATADFTGETGGDFAEIATASSTAGASLTTQVQAADLASPTTVSGGSFTASETLAAFRTIVLALKPPPAPTSDIVGAAFNFASHRRLAPGSDNWPLTWADDGHQYTSWGDGGGFGGTNVTGRVSMGIARIEGSDPATAVGVNINGGLNPESGNSTWPNHSMGDVAGAGKSYGIISIGGVLYMWVNPGSAEGHLRTTLWRSNDKGDTWTETSVEFPGTEGTEDLAWPTIVQMGQDYGLNSDGYIYSAWVHITDPPSGSTFNVQAPGEIHLSRVLVASIETEAAHEWFTGIVSEVPTWSTSMSASVPMYTLASGVGFHASGITWIPGAQRFVMCVDWNPAGSGNTASAGGLKLVQSENPWGPWTEFYSTDSFGAGTLEQNPVGTFGYFISPKWQDGLDFALTCTGLSDPGLDSYNTIEGAFVTDTTLLIWRFANSPVVGDLRIRDVAYSPELDRLVAVGDDNDGGSARVLESSDGGETWTVNTSAPDKNYRGVVWAPWSHSAGAFILVAGGGGEAGDIVAYNGTDFFERNPPNKPYISAATDVIGEVTAAVATGGTNPVSFSTDDTHTTWTAGTLANQTWQRVRALPGGGFIACSTTGASHRIAVSADGASWTLVGGATTTANEWFSLGVSPDRIVAVASTGTNRVMYSDDDGASWTRVASANENALWAGVLWVPEQNLWVSVARSDGGTEGPNQIQISQDDGETWTLQSAPQNGAAGFGHWNDVIRVPAVGGRGLRLVAVSGGGAAGPIPGRGLIMLGEFASNVAVAAESNPVQTDAASGSFQNQASATAAESNPVQVESAAGSFAPLSWIPVLTDQFTDANGAPPDPNKWAVDPPIIPPEAPSNLVATAVSPTRVDLTWVDNSGNETGFPIRRRIGSGPGVTDPLDTAPANAELYSDQLAQPATVYTYSIRAVGEAGDSETIYSNSVTTPAETGELEPDFYQPSGNIVEDIDYDLRARVLNANQTIHTNYVAGQWNFSLPQGGQATISGANNDVLTPNPSSPPVNLVVRSSYVGPETVNPTFKDVTFNVIATPSGSFPVVLEPGGGTILANFDGSTKDWSPQGWTFGGLWADDNKVSVVADATSKFGNAIEKRFFQGQTWAGWNGTVNKSVGLWAILYVRMVLQYSSAWVWHPSNGKYIYLHNSGTGANKRNFILAPGNVNTAQSAFGTAPSPGRPLATIDESSGFGWWVANLPGLVRNTYHTVEQLITVDLTANSGSLRVALDGVEATNWALVGSGGEIRDLRSNVDWFFNDSVGDKRIGGLCEAFLFAGGTGGIVPADMNVRLSEFYIKGLNP